MEVGLSGFWKGGTTDLSFLNRFRIQDRIESGMAKDRVIMRLGEIGQM